MEDAPEVVTEAELTALALADPGLPLAADAVPLDVYLGRAEGLLPDWYMAPARTHRAGPMSRMVVLAVVGALLVIEAFGLCSTYGQLPFH